MMGEQQRGGKDASWRALGAMSPADHILRRIDRLIDLGELRDALAPHYSRRGRPSIAPELLVRMSLIARLYGITSERRPCEEVRFNLAYRWFCRLPLDAPGPHEDIELGGLAAYFRYLDEEKAIAGADVFRAQGLSHLCYIKDKIVFPTSDILKIYKNAKDAVASKKIKDPAAWQPAFRNALIAQMIKRDAEYKRDSRRILYPTWLPPHPDEAEDLKPTADDPARSNNERDDALDPRLRRTSRKPGSFKLASIKYDPS